MWCVPHAVARTEKKNWNPIWGYVCPILHRERRWYTRSETQTKPAAIRNCIGRCKGREDNGGTTVLLSLRSRWRMRRWPCWVVADDEDVHSVCRATCVSWCAQRETEWRGSWRNRSISNVIVQEVLAVSWRKGQGLVTRAHVLGRKNGASVWTNRSTGRSLMWMILIHLIWGTNGRIDGWMTLNSRVRRLKRR